MDKQSFGIMWRIGSRWACLSTLLVAVVTVVSGCGGGGPPPPDAQLNVEEIATWYNIYRSKHNRQPPPNEAAFVAFINKTMKEDQGITEGMREDFLISPRDGKKFVINYGKPMSTNADKNIVVYEQDGYDGKKWYATEQGYGSEVDDAMLKQLLSAK